MEDFGPHRPFLYSFLDESFDVLYRAENRVGALPDTFAGLTIFIACLGLLGLWRTQFGSGDDDLHPKSAGFDGRERWGRMIS